MSAETVELSKILHLKLWKSHPEHFLFGKDPVSGRPIVYTIDQNDPSNPVKPLPTLIHLRATLSMIQRAPSPILVIAKSRQVMITWFIVAYHLWRALFLPEQRIFFISKNETSATELVDRVKKIYLRLPEWIREAFPTSKPIKDLPAKRFELAHGSRIEALPRGAEQIRQHTATGIFIDEAAFVPDLEETVAASLPAIARDAKIIVVSTAFRGGYFQELAYPMGYPISPKLRQIALEIAREIRRIRRKPEGYPEVSESSITVFRGIRIYENPKAPVVEIHYSCWEKAQQHAERMRDHLDRNKFRREFEIDWESSGGSFIFRPILEKRKDEIIRPIHWDPESGSIFYGLDWGHAEPTAILELGYDPEQDIVYVLWELYQEGMYLHDIASAILSRPLYTSPNCLGVFADPSIFHRRVPKSRRSAAGVGDALREYGLRIVRAPISPVERVQRILSRLSQDKPSLIISPSCDFLISELMNLQFDEKHPDHPSGSSPDHAFDALGYGLYAVRFQGSAAAETVEPNALEVPIHGPWTDSAATFAYWQLLEQLKEPRLERFGLRKWLIKRQRERRQQWL